MEEKTCWLCGHSLPPRRRKYCPGCAGQASLLWKRQQRKANRGSRYWLDHWCALTGGDEERARRAYNDYMRAYMRRYRSGGRGRGGGGTS